MLQDLLSQVLSGGHVQQISRQIGADESKVSGALQMALPLIVGALSRNASNQQGAESLFNAVTTDHDGSILNNVDEVIAAPPAQGPGAGILNHVFGNRQQAVANEISQQSGLNIGQVAQLLITLAPLIMGVLGKTQQSQGLDAGGLAGALAQQQQQYEQSSSPWINIATQVLDSNHDGSVVDDLASLASRYFTNR